MKTHCSSCGCHFRFRARPFERFLAPPEKQKRIAQRATRENLSREATRSLLAADSTRTVWVLSYTCTGCGMIGTWGEAYTQADAEARAAEQNALLETPEAKSAAAHWEDEVDRRIAEESRHFAALFCERFPTWQGCLEQRAGEGLRASIPSENTAVSEPLGIEIQNGEVLIWWLGGWHVHVCRKGEFGTVEHLQEALDILAQLTNEELVTVASFVEGKQMGGGTIVHGQELEWRWKIDTMQLRSWRGSHDRVVTKPKDCSD